jgi:hypothetical protein
MAVTPPAAHQAMITLATPIHRRSGIANATGLLDISSSSHTDFFDRPESD